MTFRFRFDRTLQAAGVLLQLDEGRMAYIRLLKLLYIADRELLAETGRTLTGDTAVAMRNGPVLSRVYDLIKGVASQPEEWGEHIRTIHYSVELKKDPGKGKLSKGDLEKLNEVTERFRHMDDWELSEHTHDFSEWKTRFELAPSSPILWEEILKAQGKEEWVKIVERDEASQRYLDSLFGA